MGAGVLVPTESRLTSDIELIRSVRQGSTAAMEVLYRRYLLSVWRYALVRLHGNWHAAEDIVSEVFLAFVREVGRLELADGSLLAWLMGVTRNKLGDYWRRQKRAQQEHAVADMQRLAASDSTDSLEAAERCTKLADAMDGLADGERLALEWKYLEGLSVREIAARLGRTEKSVESLLHRARVSFRRAFSGSVEPTG